MESEVAGAASTARRLCNKAQGWAEGTTLGAGDGGAANPNGVVAGGDPRWLVFWPPGHNPVGVDGHRRAIAQGWRCANPGLCCTTPLGLEFSAVFQLILSLMDKAPARPGNSRKALALGSVMGRFARRAAWPCPAPRHAPSAHIRSRPARHSPCASGSP